ncbi:MAG TPA: GGDEF domain-containing protein [Burkholderiales bacterium]|jgi:diguanylate cyclase (GGDEF)-like protein
MTSANFISTEQVPAILARSTLFKGVDLSAVENELREARHLRVEPGEILLDPKEVNLSIYVVLSGELLVCLEPTLSNPLVRMGAGECVGELSIIDTALPSAYVMPSTATQLLAISKEVLWRMMALEQNIAVNLLYVLSQRIRESNVVLLGNLEIQREYRNRAETDSLTGLHNRNWFEEVFPKQLELCERIGQHASLLMADIDHFKSVNDEYGHQGGDDALRHIGRLFLRNLRGTDLCARYGGEEIIVLMPGTEISQARVTAERLRESIAAAPLTLPDGRQVKLTISGGLARWQPGMILSGLINTADRALYQAKQGGRNQIAMGVTTRSFGGR